ncbi:hypothetical protein UVI_02053310 [Ustilaginoidea virens]|nr:hypothetical protein UVI_02053310 [Ustilaginoidea virens]
MGENGVDVQSPAAQDFYHRRRRGFAPSPSITSSCPPADQSNYDGSTYGGSDMGDTSYTEDLGFAPKQLSMLSPEPRREVSGVVAGQPPSRRTQSWDSRCIMSAGGPSLHRRGYCREYACPIDENERPQNLGRRWDRDQARGRGFKSGLAVDVSASNNLQHDSTRGAAPARSISPPVVPRYRHGNKIATMQEQGDRQNTDFGHADVYEPEHAASTGRGQETGRSRQTEHHRHRKHEQRNHDARAAYESEDSECDMPIPNAPPRPARPRPAPVAPPSYHAEWQTAVRRAVEESLAQMPLSADLKFLLELSRRGLSLQDMPHNVGLQSPAAQRGSVTSMSTPTTDVFDYSSISAGRPQSRHTARTSIDSSVKLELHPRADYCSSLSRETALERANCTSPTMSTVEHDASSSSRSLSSPSPSAPTDTKPQPSTAADTSDHARGGQAIMETDDCECLTSDYSDADSFAEKRQQLASDGESLLLNEGKFGDISNSLPGIVNIGAAADCMICRILANLQGVPLPTGPCSHNGRMSKKQRLQALGYDYDSDESEQGEQGDQGDQGGPGAAKETAPPCSRKKKLISGSGGGLRRLKLVDDRIEEDSEEERDPAKKLQQGSELRRKSGMGLRIPTSPLASVHGKVAGNA